MNEIINIVLIEDDPGHSELIRIAFLKVSNFHTFAVDTLTKAKECLENNFINFIICDVRLPDGDGIEFINDNSLSEQYPIIIMTSYGDEKRAVEAMKSGVLDYIVKSEDTLLNMHRQVERVLREWQLIVKRKAIEEELKRSNLIMTSIFSATPVGIGLVKNRVLTEINETLCLMTGYSKEELINKNARVLYPNDEEYTFVGKEKYHQIKEKGTGSVECIWKKKNGELINIILSSTPLDVHDITKGVTFTAIDITWRKLSEKALIESEKRYRDIFWNSPVGIYRSSLDGKLLLANPTLIRMMGFESLEEMQELDFIKNGYTNQEDRFKFIKTFDKSDISQNNELIWKRKNGSEIIINEHSRIIRDDKGNILYFEGTVEDITEKKLSEKALFESELNYRTTIDTIDSYIHVIDKDFKIVLTNELTREASRALGYKGNFINDNLFEVFPFLKENIKEEYLKVIESKKILITEESNIINYNEVISETRKIPVIEKGEVKRVITIIRDITVKKRNEFKIRENEKQLRQVIDLVPHYIFAKDENGKFILANQAVARLYATTVEQLLGKSDADFNNKSELDKSDYYDKILFQSNQEVFIPEETITGVDGKTRYIQTTKIPFIITDDGKKSILGVSVDITERKKSEEELGRVAKLESIGILAGGIAHNFKNILASMALNAGFAKFNPSKTKEYVEKIENQIEYASALATRFQTFSTGGEPIKGIIDLRKIIEDTESMALSGSNCVSEFLYSDNLWNIFADAKQIHEVFMNLLINAKQAMPKGGTIHIRAENIEIPQDFNPNLSAGRYIKVLVIDEGIGISPKNLNYIFDPFFSTKEEGHGLGLSSVHYIIQKHKGSIKVNSTIDTGTTFELYLPASNEKTLNQKTDDMIIKKGNNSRILFMDDDEYIRENMIEFGELLNYSIEGVANGEQAIESYKKSLISGNPYSVVILDLTIRGGMGGEETLAELKKIEPKIKAIVFSGHSTKPVVAQYEKYGFKGKLEKPVNLKEFTNVLQNVINS